MKILKRAQQHNVQLNKAFYSRWELEEMLERHEIFYFEDEYPYRVSYKSRWYDDDYRIFLDDMKEIKVICYDGYYTSVVVDNYGKKYFVLL